MEPATNVPDLQTDERQHMRRRTCGRCMRPQRVCVCKALPSQPLRLLGHVLILQHPHELKRRLATVPLLKCCLDEQSLTVVVGRKLQQPGSNTLIGELLGGAQRGHYPLYVLFPGPDAEDLATLTEAAAHAAALRRAIGRKAPAHAHAPAPSVLPTSPSAATRAMPAQAATGVAAKPAQAAATSAEGAAEAVAAAEEESVAYSGVQDGAQRTVAGRSTGDLYDSNSGGEGRGGSGGRSPEAVPPDCGGAGPCTTDAAADPGAARDSSSISITGGGSISSSDGGSGGARAETDGAAARDSSGSAVGAALPPPAYLLLVVDGTWRQAREMFRVVAPRCLPPGIQVSLKLADVMPAPQRHPQLPQQQQQQQQQQEAEVEEGEQQQQQQQEQQQQQQQQRGAQSSQQLLALAQGDDAAQGAVSDSDNDGGAAGGDGDGREVLELSYDPDMPCLIRKEPSAGFVTTYEAAVRAVGLLERDRALGTELLAPLRLLTRLQATFSPSILSRMRAEPEPSKERRHP